MYNFSDTKTNTSNFINYTKNQLYELTGNHKISGTIIFIIHFILGGSTLLFLLFGSTKSDFYLISMITWIIIFILHVYFKGCIFVKLERVLWDNKNWYGPWTLPFYFIEFFGIKINGKNSNAIFIGWGLLLSIFVLYKIFVS